MAKSKFRTTRTGADAAGNTVTVRKVELSDMIAWAKDRLLDDLQDFLNNECLDMSEGYATLPEDKRKILTAMTRLLSLPDDAPETLHALSFSYWNGSDDTFWESHDMPDGYVGPLPVNSMTGESREITEIEITEIDNPPKILGQFELAFDGAIRRKVRGNCEEIRRPGDKGYNEWNELFSS